MATRAGCADCGRAYGDEHGFPDLLVPDEVWLEISPTGHGGGLLCPSCIVGRLVDRGLAGVPFWWASGPFHQPHSKPPWLADESTVIDADEFEAARRDPAVRDFIRRAEERWPMPPSPPPPDYEPRGF